ncbi:MAG TPA: hypothetical protein VGP72_02675 [Planctomycetota bacterium]
MGAQVADALGQYQFFRSRCEFRKSAGEGDDVIVLSGNNKWSPHIHLSFHVGRNFAAAKPIEKLLGLTPFYYQIHQWSQNTRYAKSLRFAGPCTWSIDINSPPESLVPEIVAAIHGIADPFLERFAKIEVARDALATNDPWCVGGSILWRQLLVLDLTLNDLAHFETWAKSNLKDFSRVQAAEMIAQYHADTARLASKE